MDSPDGLTARKGCSICLSPILTCHIGLPDYQYHSDVGITHLPSENLHQLHAIFNRIPISFLFPSRSLWSEIGEDLQDEYHHQVMKVPLILEMTFICDLKLTLSASGVSQLDPD